MALMGKNNHHSVLNDDASLFQVQKPKSEKQKWTELNTHQRLQYFLDYYLIKCLLCAAAAAIVATLLWGTLRPRKECMLFVAVVQDYLVPQEKNQLEDQLAQLLITDTDHQEIQIDDVFPNGYESDAKLSTYLAAQEIDLIITNEERFYELAEAGCFEDLNIYLPELADKHSELLCWSAVVSEEDAIQPDSSADQSKMKENNAAYGMYLLDSSIVQAASDTDAKPVIGIVKGSLRKENAADALTDVFFSK